MRELAAKFREFADLYDEMADADEKGLLDQEKSDSLMGRLTRILSEIEVLSQ